MRNLLMITFNILLLTCVFDPADKIFHLKVPTFILLFVLLVIDSLIKNKTISFNKRMLLYVSLFSILLPLISLSNYSISYSDYNNYEGFAYFKSYLFLTISFVIYRYKIDMFKTLSYMLVLLSLSILAVFALTLIGSIDPKKLYEFGIDSGIFALMRRSYGGLEYLGIYFHTAPLLVIPLGYFYYKFRFVERKFGYETLILVPVILSMLFAGTRNSILFAVLTPILLEFCFGKRKILFIGVSIAVGLGLVIKFNSVLMAMLDPNEFSNSIKLSYFKDYSEVFTNPKNIFFGQGMGASFYSAILDEYVSVVELTYIEIIRVHGIFIAAGYLFMLALPFINYKQFRENKYILVIYFAYLAMSATNPFIFSSTGMIILAAVITPMFSHKKIEYLNVYVTRANNPVVGEL